MTKLPSVVCFESAHQVRVLATQPALPPIVWTVDVVAASPPRDTDDYDDLLDETFGSSCDWTDELRFDNRSCELRSLILNVPEAPTGSSLAEEWRATPVATGGLAAERDEPFDIDPAHARSLSEDGTMLVCTLEKRTMALHWRLQVSPALAVLFEGEQYMGWALSNPLVHLAPWGLAGRFEGQVDAGVLEAVRDLHGLLAPAGIAALTNRDPDAIRRVRSHADAVEALPRGPQRDVLRTRLRDLLDLFGR